MRVEVRLAQVSKINTPLFIISMTLLTTIEHYTAIEIWINTDILHNHLDEVLHVHLSLYCSEFEHINC